MVRCAPASSNATLPTKETELTILGARNSSAASKRAYEQMERKAFQKIADAAMSSVPRPISNDRCEARWRTQTAAAAKTFLTEIASRRHLEIRFLSA